MPSRTVHRRDNLVWGAQLPRPQADPLRLQPLLQEPFPPQPMQTPHSRAQGCPVQVHEAAADLHVPGRGRRAAGGPHRPPQDRPQPPGARPLGDAQPERARAAARQPPQALPLRDDGRQRPRVSRRRVLSRRGSDAAVRPAGDPGRARRQPELRGLGWHAAAAELAVGAGEVPRHLHLEPHGHGPQLGRRAPVLQVGVRALGGRAALSGKDQAHS